MNKKDLGRLDLEASKAIDMLSSIIADLVAEVNDLQDEIENLEAELERYQEEDN